MPNSVSYLAYPDVKDVFDRAMLGKGIELTFKDHRAAQRFIARANAFRLLDRKENCKLYETTHTLFGRSAYDVLRITKHDNAVRIMQIVLDVESIKEL